MYNEILIEIKNEILFHYFSVYEMLKIDMVSVWTDMSRLQIIIIYYCLGLFVEVSAKRL